MRKLVVLEWDLCMYVQYKEEGTDFHVVGAGAEAEVEPREILRDCSLRRVVVHRQDKENACHCRMYGEMGCGCSCGCGVGWELMPG